MIKKTDDMMPVLFIGHGSPMNAIEDNKFSRTWRKIAEKIPRPKCILCISAHWLKYGVSVTSNITPKIIYGFYGFPDKLYKVKYPVRGSKEYASIVKDAIRSVDVSLDDSWGIDHGTWSVLVHMYPDADIPVIQLSIDPDMKTEKHYAIGKELMKLRSQGVLIIGSGNIVHNLGMIDWNGTPYPWAVDFDDYVKSALEKNDFSKLINYEKHPSSSHAVPTNDHYLPLLYVIGASDASDAEKPKFYCEKIAYGSLAMRCVVYGLK
jgi:4,5-DOPA dioxygenase extradiol